MTDPNTPLNPLPPPLPPMQPIPATIPTISTSTPPPASSSPSVNLSVPQPARLPGESREEAELANLSPFVIMKKKDEFPTTTEAPMVRPQPGPDQPFILPADQVAPLPVPEQTFTPPPASGVAIPISKPLPANPPAVPKSAAPAFTLPGTEVPLRSTPLIPKSQPVPPMVVNESSSPIPLMPEGSGNRVGLIATIGGVLALLILVGGGYVLALGGARIPLLYSMVSGLSGDGVKVSKKAVTYVGAVPAYQFNGEVFLQIKSSESKPTLPASDTVANSTTKISAIHSAVDAADPLAYSEKEKILQGKMNIAVDSGKDVPVYLNTAQESLWLFNLPANTVTPVVKSDSVMLSKTLLYPVLQPIPLGALLSGIKNQTDYRKVEGKRVARYTYSLDTAGFNKYFPEGATLTSMREDVEYTWKTGVPTKVILQADFDYQGIAYHIAETWNYTEWKALTPGSDSALGHITNETAVATATQIRTSEFISQLGIAGIDALPNTVVESTVVPVITPTGEGITSILSPITIVPPVPTTPANAEAIARDTQRMSDLADLQKALNEYKSKEGAYPIARTMVQTRASSLLMTALVPTYLTKMPVDPLKDTYWYEFVSDGSGYSLRSVAEDSANAKAVKGKAYYYYELSK